MTDIVQIQESEYDVILLLHTPFFMLKFRVT